MNVGSSTRRIADGHPIRHALVVRALVVGALVAMSGCSSQDSASPVAGRTSQTGTGSKTSAPSAGTTTSRRRQADAARALVGAAQSDHVPKTRDGAVSPEFRMPEVFMSSGHAATCRVNVGDTFPDLALTSLEGQPTSLSSILGKRLTIVVFWNRQQPASVEQIRRLQSSEFADDYRDAGLSVVTVNVANSRDDVRGLLEVVPNDFANTLDPNGEAFAQVATGVLPRTYLVDADRQLVWFDLEFSRSTRRELLNAIRYVLRRHGRQASSSGPSLK